METKLQDSYKYNNSLAREFKNDEALFHEGSD